MSPPILTLAMYTHCKNNLNLMLMLEFDFGDCILGFKSTRERATFEQPKSIPDDEL